MDANRNMLWGRLIAEELARSGVRWVCIAPGSRSGPLAIACAEEFGTQSSVHLDERSAGFFALGLAKGGRAPAAVLCTSGTAAANLLPAVVEAFHSKIPLVVLTADRPPELRNCAAPQTIDQLRLYGSHALSFSELPAPQPEPTILRSARATVCRMVATALGPPAGPVHLNVPFRDPLDPRVVAGDIPTDLPERDPLAFRGRRGSAYVAMSRSGPAGGGAALERLLEQVSSSSSGLIVAGPQPHGFEYASSVYELGRVTGYPILADCLSQLRQIDPEPGLLGAYDGFLRSSRLLEAYPPDLILRVGAPPVSKTLNVLLAGLREIPQVLIDGDGGVADPGHSGVEVLRANPRALAAELAERVPKPVADPRFVEAMASAESRAQEALARAAAEEWFEASLVRTMSEVLPEGAMLFAGNSMPIRELDAFLPVGGNAIEVLANRGANGIDGVVSTALGAMAARGADRPGALLIGDVSLIHDMGGLMAARRQELPLVTVVIHNDGGAIFSYLPVNGQTERFEELFTTPHGLDFEPLAKLHGLRFARAAGPEFRDVFAAALQAAEPALIEVRLNRERSVKLHRQTSELVVRSVEQGLDRTRRER